MDGKAELKLVPPQENGLGGPKESNVQEIQRAILEEVLYKLKDEKAVTLVYPNTDPFYVINQGKDADYNHGSQIRFAVLNNSRGSVKDEVCIAILNNRSRSNSKSFGSSLHQLVQGNHSEKEISVSRFVQTLDEKAKHTGTYSRLNLSDTVDYCSATYSEKGNTDPHRKMGDSPTFSERWSSGNAQLAPVIVYDVLGQIGDLTLDDYKDILVAVKQGKIDKGLTGKVVQSQSKDELAQVVKGGQDLVLQ